MASQNVMFFKSGGLWPFEVIQYTMPSSVFFSEN